MLNLYHTSLPGVRPTPELPHALARSATSRNHLMYKVSRLMENGDRLASVIAVDSILSSVHLIPQFGQNGLQNLNSFTITDNCQSFYVNPFSDRDNYLLFS
jgi:hypothetical protein